MGVYKSEHYTVLLCNKIEWLYCEMFIVFVYLYLFALMKINIHPFPSGYGDRIPRQRVDNMTNFNILHIY